MKFFWVWRRSAVWTCCHSCWAEAASSSKRWACSAAGCLAASINMDLDLAEHGAGQAWQSCSSASQGGPWKQCSKLTQGSAPEITGWITSSVTAPNCWNTCGISLPHYLVSCGCTWKRGRKGHGLFCLTVFTSRFMKSKALEGDSGEFAKYVETQIEKQVFME